MEFILIALWLAMGVFCAMIAHSKNRSGVAWFFGGILFCFYWVLPFVINFLLGFNQKLGLQPLLRIDEYVSFTVMLPVISALFVSTTTLTEIAAPTPTGAPPCPLCPLAPSWPLAPPLLP